MRVLVRLARAVRDAQIAVVPITLPPYALSSPVFPFRHLAACAGRAPIGGAREVALACFVAARLAADCCDPALPVGDAVHAARCAGAKAWLGTMSIPAPVRTPVSRCVDASAMPDAGQMAGLVTDLAAAAGGFLDQLARAELEALAARLGHSRG